MIATGYNSKNMNLLMDCLCHFRSWKTENERLGNKFTFEVV